MSRVSRRVFAIASVALLLVGVLLPLAAADHEFSHRYIVMGRLIDADGNPIVGAQVDLVPDEGVNVEGFCSQQPGTETDAWGETGTEVETNEYGEFRYCMHIHGIRRNMDAGFQVSYGDAEDFVTIDARSRYNYVVLQTDTTEGEESTDFHSSYLVTGRLFHPVAGSSRVAQVTVYANVVADEPVTVTVTPADGEPVVVETKSNNYGDFAVRVPVEDVEGAKVKIEASGESRTYDADPASRSDWVFYQVPDPNNTLQKVLLVGGGIVGAVVAVGGGVFAWRRVSENREIARARETSTRKRAQR